MRFSKKWLLLLIVAVFGVFMYANFCGAKIGGKSTEITQEEQAEIDDAIMAKPFDELTDAEKKRLKEIEDAQKLKRTKYVKRGMRKLANKQPKTYVDYEIMSKELKNKDLHDFNPKFIKDPKLQDVPDPEFSATRYNYPPGSRELNLSELKTKRFVRSLGVLSPDGMMVAYTDVNYDVASRHSSSSLYVIPVNPQETRAQKRLNYLHEKEDELHKLAEELETNNELSSEEKKLKKKELKELREEVKKLKIANEVQDKNDEEDAANETPARKAAKTLLQAHIKDRKKIPLFSVGLFENDYAVQKNLTIVDWSLNSKRILLKEKIGQDGSGLWQTNIWVYDFDTNTATKLDEVRQAIEYYWEKDRMIDLHYYRFDLYPLGWDANHSNRILLYAYGYTKDKGEPPKFLGTWSIDYKGEQTRLISVSKTGYIVQANGFCLKTKNLEYYEKE